MLEEIRLDIEETRKIVKDREKENPAIVTSLANKVLDCLEYLNENLNVKEMEVTDDNSHKDQAAKLLEEAKKEDVEYDQYNWPHCKCQEKRRYRNTLLNEILVKELSLRELESVHQRALDNQISGEDLDWKTKRNVYTDFLERSIHEIVNDMRFNIHKSGHHNEFVRKNQIKRLHEYYTDLNKINEETNESWEIIKEAWK